MVERIRGQINNLIIEIDPDITIDFGEVETIRFNKSYLETYLTQSNKTMEF
ncbi:MAG: hypothetical protein IPQ05_04445 [Leptospiraceae bacterium]|nr:hypothetical protein [Leptospiraceae bacterium]